MIRLIIADDHTVLREALSEMLSKKGGFDVVAQAKDGEELLKVLQQHGADVVIMDVAMPGLDGIAALERMSSSGLQVPVLMLSADEGPRTVRSAIRAGAKGFMLKNSTIEELRFAIESVLKGQTYLSPSVTNHLMTGDANGNALSVLTKREIEILRYLADGSPNREIGKKLHISTRTVDTHRSNILKKLNLKTNAELVKIAIGNGLITV
jgi:two-component system invasion response regulator UvrY